MDAGKEDWRRLNSVRSGVRKISDPSVPRLFAGTTGENSSHTNNVAVKCLVHKSTKHKLQECRAFESLNVVALPSFRTVSPPVSN